MLAMVADRLLADLSLSRDEFVQAIVGKTSRYGFNELPALRRNIELISRALADGMRRNDRAAVVEAILSVMQERINTGFAPLDVVEALLAATPITRRIAVGIARQARTDETAAANATEEFVLGVVSDVLRHVSDGQQLALEKIEFQAREASQQKQQLTKEHTQLQALHEKVVGSLSAGVCFVETGSNQIQLHNRRFCEIMRLPTTSLNGKRIDAVFAAYQGIPIDQMIERVRATDRLPGTKLTFTTPTGEALTVLLRVERLRGGNDDVRGSIVIVDDISEREVLLQSISRFVSPAFAARLLEGRQSDLGEAEERDITVLFADIRGFTSMSETMPLIELHAMLNSYFSAATDAIAEHGGTIDKFIGDNIMAIFASGEDFGANAAVQTALSIVRKVDQLNVVRARAGAPALDIGIGIATGRARLGVLGARARASYTAIGDTVNVAARLQAMAGPRDILFSEATRQHITQLATIEALGPVRLKGRQSPINLFSVRLAAEPVVLDEDKTKPINLPPPSYPDIDLATKITRLATRDGLSDAAIEISDDRLERSERD